MPTATTLQFKSPGVVLFTDNYLPAMDPICCICGSLICDCSGLPSALDLRIRAVCQSVVTPKCTDYDYSGELVQQAGTPAGYSCPNSGWTVGKYYKGTISLACANPSSFDVEAVCCQQGDLRGIQLRVDGGVWYDPTDIDDLCSSLWEFVNVTEISDTGANCGNCPEPVSSPSAFRLYVRIPSVPYADDC